MDGEGYGSGELVTFKLQYGHASTDMVRSVESTVGDLKEEIACLHGIPKEMQKVLFKGLLNEDGTTLKEMKLKNGAKMLLVGSSPKDLLSVAAHPPEVEHSAARWDEQNDKIPLPLQEKHLKVLRKGPPDGSLPGIKGIQCPLPENEQCIPGLLNALGNKARLTFKPEANQLWIGSAQATQKGQILAWDTLFEYAIALGSKGSWLIRHHQGPWTLVAGHFAAAVIRIWSWLVDLLWKNSYR